MIGAYNYDHNCNFTVARSNFYCEADKSCVGTHVYMISDVSKLLKLADDILYGYVQNGSLLETVYSTLIREALPPKEYVVVTDRQVDAVRAEAAYQSPSAKAAREEVRRLTVPSSLARVGEVPDLCDGATAAKDGSHSAGE